MSNEGHEQVVGTLVRNLSFDYHPEDLEILVSIVCADVKDVATVRKFLQKSSQLLKTDPSEVINSLQPKVETIRKV